MVKRNIKVLELVSSWDKDKDGSIDAVEFARNMQMMVPNAKDGEVRSLFERLDAADSKVELESFRELLRGLERRASKARDEERALAAHVKELKSEASAGQQALLAAIEKDEAEERTREEAAAQATAAEEAGRGRRRRQRHERPRPPEQRRLRRRRPPLRRGSTRSAGSSGRSSRGPRRQSQTRGRPARARPRHARRRHARRRRARRHAARSKRAQPRVGSGLTCRLLLNSWITFSCVCSAGWLLYYRTRERRDDAMHD